MAQDQTGKRRNLASEAVIHATAFVDALTALQTLKEERLQAGDFQDADFDGTDLAHLPPGMVGQLFDFVVPDLSLNYEDAANGGRNKQVLLQMRR